jgi:hypothetical protein
MIETITVDHSRFNAQLDALLDASEKDAPDVLKSEHARLTNLIVNFVPPPKHVGDPQTVGEAAVKKDLYSLISEADERALKPIIDQYGTENIDAYRTYNKQQVHLQWDHIAIGSEQLADLHNQYRNQYGRINRRKSSEGQWNSPVVVVKGLRDEYVAAVQENVGRMKSRWAYCAHLLGSKFPNFISRHFRTTANESTATIDLTSKNPSIIFGGRGRGFGQTRDAIRDAGNIRSKQIAKRIEFLTKVYKKDIESGTTVRPHALETDIEPLEEAA